MKKVLVLGSTGSIGVNTLNVIRNFPDKFSVAALTINTRIDLLEPQIYEFKPPVVVVKDDKLAAELRKKLTVKCEVLSGIEGLIYVAANLDYDILLGAMVGFAGLAPTLEAIKHGKRIALANKETLVVGGELVTELCEKYNAELIPVDSEHSAIYQCLVGEDIHSVQKIILTASGGPFLHLNKEKLKNVTVKEALNHPTWKMGNKVTIHPQSIIHSMVEFIDGSIKAQMGLPDMRLPIQYALGYPERLKSKFQKTCLPDIKTLTFFSPDLQKFECLKLAYQVLNDGGTAPCVLNAANEIAVDRFLNGDIKFSYIPTLINKTLDKIENHKSPDVETIFECDKLARDLAV